jgi:D-alanyl-D-alanine carboxypeptidase
MTLSRRLLLLLMLLTMMVTPAVATTMAQEAAELKITSSRYIVIDAATGYVFAQRDAHERVAIASVTKVFTAVQALAMAPLDTPITTSDFDLRRPDGDYFGSSGTLMGFGVEETYTLEDMLYGMLLPSGNDAANAIARSLGARPGDTDEEAVQHFLDLLNQRVVDMGLEDTHFMNPHGWGVDGHYSTAADVAAFNRFVTQFPTLMGIMGTTEYTTSNGALTVRNTNRSLNLYPSVEAGKTGYDDDAGYCLVNIASRDDAQMISVTLDGVAPGDWYDDNATLLDWGFDQRAALASSGESFDGDVLGFVDPGIADIARSAVPESNVASQSQEAVAEPPPTSEVAQVVPESEPVVDASVIENPRMVEGAIWVAAVAVIGVIGARGLWAFKSHGGSLRRLASKRPHLKARSTPPADESVFPEDGASQQG